MTVPAWPSATQQRALAYAPKAFALISFLSCLVVMYYLLVRRPEKRRRMYHRLVLATFVCFLPLTVAIFWGTWAMPDVPWAVGTAGNTATCTIQGFLIMTFYLAFPFYYASFSIFAYVALKNNFQEEKYAWMEKWIHLGAYLLPLTIATVAAAKSWLNPGLAYCTLNVNTGECSNYVDPDCQQTRALSIYAPLWFIILVELTVGTITIIYLLCRFEKIQKDVDQHVGMRRIVEAARKRRHRDVALQTGLYLLSFWFGYIPSVVETFVRATTGKLSYGLISASHCIYAFQGFVIMVIYFYLQQHSTQSAATILPAPGGQSHNSQETVSKIRAKAAMPKQQSIRNFGNSLSFRIFDGCPAEDSPWRAYLEPDHSELPGTVLEDEGEDGFPEGSLVTSLMSDSPA